jgi:cytochrome c5
LEIKSVGKTRLADQCINVSATSGAGIVSDSHTPTESRSGETVYTAVCAACHSSGAAGAPRLGDKNAWESRIKQSKDTLYQHSLSGFKAMPPRGTCSDCSDGEIRAAVDYIINEVR